MTLTLEEKRAKLAAGRPVRPEARELPQDATWGNVTRFVLLDELPYGTASALLRFAFDVAWARGFKTIIAYHDRTKHTGCIYKKAGMRRDTKAKARASGWESRSGRKSANYEGTPKRRWRIDRPTEMTTSPRASR